MECVQAERLRNLALVSISRELRILSHLRNSAIKPADLSLRKGQNIILLRRKTDQDRKALQDHLASCRHCQNTDPPDTPDLAAEQDSQSVGH
jgi:hypothetical protein